MAQDYNNLDAKSVPFEQIAERRFELLQKIVGRVGEGTFIEPPFMPDYGCNISIGRDCFMNFKLALTVFVQLPLLANNSSAKASPPSTPA